MREDYLHYLFASKSLGNSFTTTTGLMLIIQEFGQLNPNAGPDFLNAKILLETTVWVGSIEFHVRSSDWVLHKHQADSRYDNVIAHFVFEHDEDIKINGVKIPTVELKNSIDLKHFQRFRSVTDSKHLIPCSANIHEVDPFVVFQQKERAMFNRLIRKAGAILADLEQQGGDLEGTFYKTLAKAFGGNVNALAFEQLFEKIEFRVVKKLRDNSVALPAVLFGMAGLLPEKSDDSYVQELICEFNFQRHRLKLYPMTGLEFRFSRMHPAGFPTIRLAQLIELIRKNLPLNALFSGGLSLDEIRSLLQVTLPSFWNTHYRFDRITKEKSTQLSAEFTDLLVINAVVPFLFAIGLRTDDEKLKEYAIICLNQIQPESNSIVKLWGNLGIPAKTAFDTQALIEQKNEFCSKKKCLFCTVGVQLLKS